MALMRSAAQMSVATAISRITGFLRIMSMASAIGLDRLADSYNLANVMPNMVYELLMGGILSSLFIPLFIDYLLRDKDEAWRVASIIINVAALILLFFTVLGVVLAAPIVRLLTALVPGDAAEVRQTIFFFRLFIPQIFFYGIGAVFTGLLNSHKRFLVPAVAPIINNLTVIATVWLVFVPVYLGDPEQAILNLALGTTAGVVMMAAVQIPPILKIGWRYSVVVDLRHRAVRDLARLSLPVLGYVACNMVGLAVTYNLAFSKAGGITAYQYAWTIFQLPHGIFAVSISTAMFPLLAEHVSNGRIDKLKEAIIFSLRMTAFIIIPAAAGIVALSRPIVRLCFERGAFGAQATTQTTPVLACFALGLLSFSAYMFMTRTYYALKDTRTPLMVNMIGVPINIVLNIVLFRFAGIPGLALGHALTYSFTFMLMMAGLRRRIGPLGIRPFVKASVRFLLISAPAAVGAYYLASLLEPASGLLMRTLQLLLAIAAVVIVYFAGNWLLRTEELHYFNKIISREVAPEMPGEI